MAGIKPGGPDVLGYVVLVALNDGAPPQFGAVPELHALLGAAEDEAEYRQGHATAAGRRERYTVAQLIRVDGGEQQ